MAVVEKYDMEREAMVDERTQLRSNLAAQMRDISKEIVNIKAKNDFIYDQTSTR